MSAGYGAFARPVESRKGKILEALDRWIRQRPGMQFCNYGNVSAYRSEQRSITRDLHDAQQLMAQVAWRESITADHLLDAAQHSYSGRLTLTETDKGVRVEYCTGQYFPTEYRKAVCAVLSSALWDYIRADIPNEGRNGKSAGDLIRDTFRREFGARMQRRWFD